MIDDQQNSCISNENCRPAEFRDTSSTTTERTEYHSHSIESSVKSSVLPTTNATEYTCARCQKRRVSSGDDATLTTESFGREGKWNCSRYDRPVWETPDKRDVIKSEKFFANKKPGGRGGKTTLSRAICPHCNNIHDAKLVLDPLRLRSRWFGISSRIIRAIAHFLDRINRR
jgi:hypothetical protein